MSKSDFSDWPITKIRDAIRSGEGQSDWISGLRGDDRAGVRKLADTLERHFENIEKLKRRFVEMDFEEQIARKAGFLRIAGIDEVGRGPLAGPVVAAAVILDPEKPIIGLDDSKRLSESQREELHERILRDATAIGIGRVDSRRIDEINILEATKEAMQMAVSQLEAAPDLLLIDALSLELPIKQKSLIKGDQRCNAIAAASIVAKVTRDREMVEQAKQYPDYAFEQNKGYGTARHYEGLDRSGMTPIHRRSFLNSWRSPGTR